MPLIFPMILKNKTAFWTSLVPKGIYIIKYSDCQTCHWHTSLSTWTNQRSSEAKSTTWKYREEQLSYTQKTLRKSDILSCFIVSSGRWAIFKNFKYFLVLFGYLLGAFYGGRPFGRSLRHDGHQTSAAMEYLKKTLNWCWILVGINGLYFVWCTTGKSCFPNHN